MGGRGQRASVMGASGAKIDVVGEPRDFISERERKRAEVDSALDAFKSLRDEYGEVVNGLFVAKLGKKDASVMGYSDGDNITINELFFNNDRLNHTMDKDNGYFHPKRGDKTGIQSLMAHEFGHVLTQRAAIKSGNLFTSDIRSMSTKIVTEAQKLIKSKGVVQMAAKISKYATASNAEAVAESVADVYCNGSRAKAESKAIVSVLKKYL